MERPLDTIRAFNAAAEGTSRSRTNSYNRPMSQYGSQQGSEVGGNRRSYHNNSKFSIVPLVDMLTLLRRLHSICSATESRLRQRLLSE
jgi:hypothetical protein